MQAGFSTVDNWLKIYGLPCITIFPIGGEKSVMGPEELRRMQFTYFFFNYWLQSQLKYRVFLVKQTNFE